MTNLSDRLAAERLSLPAILSTAVASLPRSMQIVPSAPLGDGCDSGTFTIVLVENALGVFALHVVPAGHRQSTAVPPSFPSPPGGRF